MKPTEYARYIQEILVKQGAGEGTEYGELMKEIVRRCEAFDKESEKEHK